jgi:hypothetical protein
VVLDVEGNATTSPAAGVALVVAFAKRLGAFALHTRMDVSVAMIGCAGSRR